MVDRSKNGAARFNDQVALVVGGAQGIGRAIAMRLAREGAHVVISDIDYPKMQETVQQACNEHLNVRMQACDVRDSSQVSEMVSQVRAWHGRVDILMYVAGIAPATPFLDLDEKTWDDTIDINLRGAFLVAKAVAPLMIERKQGKLVFMASTNSWDGESQLAHYNASKAGLYLLAKTLAPSLGRTGSTPMQLAPDSSEHV